jgi:hypothetical protein
MEIHFENSGEPVITYKPVIYVYPEKTMPVNIQLEPKGELGFTYPHYDNGWSFTADTEGKLHFGEKQYDYIFWDGVLNLPLSGEQWKEGFLVHRDSLVSFFESKLSAMGLNSRERENFITFWCPKMSSNEMSYVLLCSTKKYDQYAHLTVNPRPDHLFRAYMLYADVTNGNVKTLQPQKLESTSREGFTVIEWGGGALSHITCRISFNKS